MIVLYLPMYTNPNLGGCSIYNRNKVWLRHFVEASEDNYVLWPILKDLEPDDYVKHKRIKLIEFDRSLGTQFHEAVFFDAKMAELFNAEKGKYYYDVVVSDLVRITPFLHMFLGNVSSGVDRNVPIISLMEFITSRDTDRFAKIYEGFEGTSAVGAYYSDMLCYETPVHEAFCGSIYRKHLTPMQMKKIMAKPKQYMGGINFDKVSAVPNNRKERPFRVNYAHRLAAHYEGEDVTALADYMFAGGRDMELVITTPSAAAGAYGQNVVEYIEKKGMKAEFHWSCKQEEFYKIANTCHAFVVCIKHAEFSAAVCEQFTCGQIGLLPDVKWTREMFPEYPFFYKDLEEVSVVLRYFYENLNTDKIQNAIKYAQGRVKQFYNLKAFQERMSVAIKDIAYTMGTTKIVKDMADPIAWPEKMSLQEFADTLKGGTTSGLSILRKKMFRGAATKFDFIRYLKQEKGYRIDYDESFENLTMRRI